MADSAPVNEVLCEAVQYLLKLGSNLRQRSEILKEKRIRKDKLRNTHAVQKATSKVLLLCELAKKSIVNVETSVKAIQDRIENMQAHNIGAKSSSSENISVYEYFTYNSKRLKCRNKINIKHYSSANVCVSKMPTAIQDKYPVFYDCKLFRLRLKSDKIARNNLNKRNDSENNKKTENTEPEVRASSEEDESNSANVNINTQLDSDNDETDSRSRTKASVERKYYKKSKSSKKKNLDHIAQEQLNVDDNHESNNLNKQNDSQNIKKTENVGVEVNEYFEESVTDSANVNINTQVDSDNDDTDSRSKTKTSVKRKDEKKSNILNKNIDKTVSDPELNPNKNAILDKDPDESQNNGCHNKYDSNEENIPIEKGDNNISSTDKCPREKSKSIEKVDDINQVKSKESSGKYKKGERNNESECKPMDNKKIENVSVQEINKYSESKLENVEENPNKITSVETNDVSGNNIEVSEIKDNNSHKDSFIENTNSRSYESDRSVDSDISKKSFIKCVNINKLLKPDIILSPDNVASDKVSKTKCYSGKTKVKSSHKIKKMKYLKHKFKPKKFSINIVRLPKLDKKFLKKHNLKKILQFNPVQCHIYLDSDSASNDCNSKTESRTYSKKFKKSKDNGSMDKLDSDREFGESLNDSCAEKLSTNKDGNSEESNKNKDQDKDIDTIKNSLLNGSDSESTDDEIRQVNEKVKNSLLYDSDSDNNSKVTQRCNENSNEAEKMLDKNSDNILESKNDKNSSKNNEESDSDIDSTQINTNKRRNSPRVLITPDRDIANNSDDAGLPQSDRTPKNKRKRKSGSTPPSTRKKIMESMRAKRMLLRYSSSSDTDDEQLRNVNKESKEELLKNKSSSDDDSRNNKSKSLSSDRSLKLRKKTEDEKRKIKKNEQLMTDDESSNSIRQQEDSNNSTSTKMGRSKDKLDSSSHLSHNEDSDKDIKGLTNLRTLKKSYRRRRAASDRRRLRTQTANMPKAPIIGAEVLLQAESSSDAASVASNDGEVEDLPRVPVTGFNGDGMVDHLAKDDLLGDSDSSNSQNQTQNSQDDKEGESEDEDVKLKRRKANAISSDSEAGSSRRKDKRLSDFEDSEDDGLESVKKSKRKKKNSDSDASAGSGDEGKKKRRRIKNVDDSEGSGSETENEGRNKHGRKNIRKVMGKNQLEEATKKAAREEKERIARIAERQKLYNNLQFDESGKPDEVVLDKVVLDFDPETKEPLIEVDKGLVKKLKPHQANGIKFMWDACFESVKRIKKDKGSGCILAHCMGLGKTLQVVSLTHTLLTHSDLTSVNRVLVVCPLSTVLNWVNEFNMWLKHAETDYEVDVYELSRFKQNSDRAFQLQQWFQHGGVCVLGYEMFRNLSSDNTKKFKKKMLKSFQESLVDPGPDLVVCDEGHLLKNEKTSLSQAMNKVKTLRRIVLTGTPLQNNLKEYYCMVQFVKPNLLGKYNEYLNRFVNPITNGQYTDSTEHDIRIMKRRSHVLHKMLDGAVQRRDYGVLAPFLPPKHEYVLFITLAEVQTKLYQHYLDNYSRRPLAGKSSGFLFPDFQSLQRIWTHPLVLKYNSERYEIMQQKKREREEEDSEGSLKDFIDDESTSEESSSEESTDESSYLSDDSRKKNKKKKSPKKSKARSTRRGTRANPVEAEDDDIQEVVEVKNENPTEWWMPLVSEEELDDMRNSHKLILLFDILRQCEAIGDKLLVFSQSLYSLDLIEHFLGKVDEATQEARVDEKLGGHVGSWSPGIDYFRLDGSTSCENRSIWCKNFNREDNPRARLFLISTRAGGLGINLVAANRVVIFDVSWNPSHDVQSIFRVYRFGQKKPCYIYRFLAMGTMEEKIYERQVTKQAISKRVIDEQQIDRHYAENDLAELYKFEPTPPQPRPIPPLPKDRLFAEMLKEHEQCIYKYHEHDSLLENKEEETLTEEERKAAWEDFENEKTRPPVVPFTSPYAMPNGMMSNYLAAQQQSLAYALAAIRKESPNITDNQLRDLMPLLYNTNPQLMQKMSEMYKYQPGMMNPGLMNSVMNPASGGAGGGGMGMGGTSGLQYEPPWQRQQQMRLQQLMQQQNPMAAKYYAGGLGSRDPVAMALQHQRAREMMLGERSGRPRGRPPLAARPKPSDDVVNLDSD
ncbi:transcriptional regulator ATRX homolog isoform X2 [Colias croceus]|uniref:transcriptional regulator ATRX homolog isoform X2 n=1 Tax=Colias crocea TaxID=72248 RepID=UPI001E27EC98|nr:transcriptional regulator ATRX homolog isoform X2 [Colias croceus]